MEKKICAYLDLMGFSNLTKTDPSGAVSLLSNYQQIINQGISESKISKLPRNSETPLINVSSISLTDSFDNFLPFSDSIFITSSDANLFILQLSNFLFRSFALTAPVFYKTENHANPYEIASVSFKKQPDGKYIQEEQKKNFYPTLFRGGISIEEFNLINVQNIIQGEPSKNTILIGKGVVSAVHLEKSIKGPRIVCQNTILELLQTDLHKLMFKNIPESNDVELLWPGIAFINMDDCLGKLYEFDQMFVPATTLWKALNHEYFGIHYYELMKLIIKSTLKVYEFYNYRDDAVKHIREVIRQVGLQNKEHDLSPK